jgi:hypothetical protein
VFSLIEQQKSIQVIDTPEIPRIKEVPLTGAKLHSRATTLLSPLNAMANEPYDHSELLNDALSDCLSDVF